MNFVRACAYKRGHFVMVYDTTLKSTLMKTLPPLIYKPSFAARELSGLGRVLRFVKYAFVFIMLLGVASMAVVHMLHTSAH